MDSRRDDHEALDALFMTLVHDVEDDRVVDEDEGEVDRAGDLREGAVGLEPVDLTALRIDGVNGAGEAVFGDAFEDVRADGVFAGGRSDDGDRTGLEDGIDGVHSLRTCGLYPE